MRWRPDGTRATDACRLYRAAPCVASGATGEDCTRDPACVALQCGTLCTPSLRRDDREPISFQFQCSRGRQRSQPGSEACTVDVDKHPLSHADRRRGYVRGHWGYLYHVGCGTVHLQSIPFGSHRVSNFPLNAKSGAWVRCLKGNLPPSATLWFTIFGRTLMMQTFFIAKDYRR